MTVPATTRKAGPYTGTGVQTVFPFSFKVFAITDVKVVVADTAGVESTLSSGYTVTANADQVASPGGSVTLSAALASGYKLTLLGNLPYDQTLALPGGGNFNPVAVENALDRIVEQVQQISETGSRVLSLPATASASGTLPVPAANKVIGWNATGDALQNLDAGTLATVVAFGTANADIFTGTGAQTVFTLSANPGAQANLDVSVGGVTQYPGFDYSWSGGTSVTFTVAPPNGVKVLLRYFQGLPQGTTDSAASTYLPAGAGAVATTVQSELRAVDAALATERSYNAGSKGAFSTLSDVGYNNIVFLGDSISRGVGASNFRLGYLYQVARSIMNWADKGPYNDRGFGYHINQQIADFVNDIGVTTTGTVTAVGLIGSRLSLTAGQSITLTKRELKYFDVIYDKATSSGSLVFALNGNTVATKATVAGAGFGNTFATAMVSQASTQFSDTMTITASGGTVVITAVLMLRNTYSSPIVHTVCQSGYKYSNYLTSAAYTEIATYLAFNANNTKPNVLVVMLGTNDIFQTGSGGVTPTQYTTNMQTLITGVTGAMGGINWKPVFSIPPKTNLSLFPVQSPGYTYNDYVNAIVSFCSANGYGLIRNDLSVLSSNTGFYADGVHPTAEGHRVMASTVCDSLGIPFNPAMKQNTIDSTMVLDEVTKTRLAGSIAYNSTWRNYVGAANLQVKAYKLNGVVILCGACEPNGSISLTLGTLPTGLAPVNRDVYLFANTFSTTPVLIKIQAGTGVITTSSATACSMEGLTYVEDSSF